MCLGWSKAQAGEMDGEEREVSGCVGVWKDAAFSQKTNKGSVCVKEKRKGNLKKNER